jgi:hypothetical protein
MIRSAALSVAAVLVLVGAGAAYANTPPKLVAAANVRFAIPNAEIYWLGHHSYAGLTVKKLRAESPGVSPHVGVVVLDRGQAYCIDDRESRRVSAYYIGGAVKSVPRHLIHTVAPGSCPR